jgi:hypothetical protein
MHSSRRDLTSLGEGTWVKSCHPGLNKCTHRGNSMGHMVRNTCRHGGLMKCHMRVHLTLKHLVSNKTIYTSYVVAYNFLALFTLAVDLLLQHRLSDWCKRSQEWTTKLRGVTKSMPKPAKVVLDSLFSVAHSYEEHVKEYNLWIYPNVSDAPMGGVVWSPPEEAVTDDQYENTRRGPESDGSTEELTIQNEWTQKMQRTTRASVLLNQQIHTELATEPSTPVDVDGNRNTITPQAQYRIISEGHTQSADADMPRFDNSGPYHMYYNANSFDQGQENTRGKIPLTLP